MRSSTKTRVRLDEAAAMKQQSRDTIDGSRFSAEKTKQTKFVHFRMIPHSAKSSAIHLISSGHATKTLRYHSELKVLAKQSAKELSHKMSENLSVWQSARVSNLPISH